MLRGWVTPTDSLGAVIPLSKPAIGVMMLAANNHEQPKTLLATDLPPDSARLPARRPGPGTEKARSPPHAHPPIHLRALGQPHAFHDGLRLGGRSQDGGQSRNLSSGGIRGSAHRSKSSYHLQR